MMHLAYPNVKQAQFQACVRYLSLPQSEAPQSPYGLADPRTPNLTGVHHAVQELVPERVDQLVQGKIAQVYEIADAPGPWQGSSLDLAYLLALIRCSRPCVLEALADAGDVWCTGALGVLDGHPVLQGVEQSGFNAKVAGFLAQLRDRLFLVPAANFTATHTDLCQQHQVQVLTLAAFREALPAALAAGGWPAPGVVLLGTYELPLLSATLFQPAPAQPVPVRTPQWSQGAGAPRRPYKFLDPFGLTDTGLFCGRDQEIVQLQRQFHATRLLILYGESGTGKTSLMQAGLLPSLPVERYAWVLVRMVHEEPTTAIKAALVREFGLDRQFLDRPLVDGVTAATATLGKTVVLVLDQFEEFFQRHDATVRQRFPDELHACLDAPRLAVQVLIALREDYFAQLATFQEAIPTIFYHTMRLTRFTRQQACDAVVQPARRLGLNIDEAFVQNDFIEQLADAAHIIELPLLQIVCEAWYQQAEEAHHASIGPGGYSALGDIRTVLERYLTTTLRQFGAEHQQAREVLKALVTGDNTARAVFPDELLSRLHTAGHPLTRQELEQHFLRQLVQARLVRATEVDGQTRYELTHEFLVPQITTWIDASDRERTRMLEMLARAYEVYLLTGQLLSAPALARLAPCQERLVLPEGQQAFLTQSQRRVHRFWRSVVGAAAGLVLLLAGGGVWYWDAYYRPHVEHYVQVITRFGLPEGIGSLTAEQVRQRHSSLAFYKHGRRGPVYEIRLVNSRGTYTADGVSAPTLQLMWLNPLPQETVDGKSEWSATRRVVFERDARGQILNQIGYNRADRRIYMLHYVHPNQAEYKTPDWISGSVRESGIALLKFVQPEHGPEAGLVQEVRYFDSAGTPQPDHDGTYGNRYLFDARGLRVEEITLGADGQPAVTKTGIARSTITYDALGHVTRLDFFGHDGQPHLNQLGVAGMQISYDPSGNLQEVVYVDTDGQLATLPLMQAAGRSFRYDAHGNIIEATFFDRHRHLVTGRMGTRAATVPGYAKVQIEWDEHGTSLETYVGPDGTPIVLGGRVVKTRGSWDARGHLAESSSFDEHKRPIRDHRGCAKHRLTRDPNGNLVAQTCLDERDRPLRSTEGFAQTKWVRDDRGNAIEESYFGATGQPEVYDEPYVKVRLRYNPQGKKAEEVYFDITDQPVNTKAGYAKITYTYNLQGKLSETAYFDAQQQPARRSGNYTKELRRYDAYDRLIEITSCDEQGQPIRDEDGSATARFEYDQQGNRSVTVYLDEYNAPAVHTDGYTKSLRRYNDIGQLEEEAYVDLDGAAVLHKEGYAKQRRTYNKRGQIELIEFFDVQDRLVPNVYGYAMRRYTYDGLGREIATTFFDVHGLAVRTQVVVKKVESNRSGAKYLHVGDILLSYNGEDIRDARTFFELERMQGEGQRELRVLRQGQDTHLTVGAGRLKGLTLVHSVPPTIVKVGP